MCEVQYTVKRHKRARSARIRITTSGEVVVTLPPLLPKLFARRFIEEKHEWICEQLHRLETQRIGDSRLFDYSRAQYEKYKEEARAFCTERVAYWATRMNAEYNRIAIKHMKTRWGSCSSKRNLNFNYKIIFLSDAQADYLIVHELAHLFEMNHSRKFWDIVAQFIPQYQIVRRELRNNL